MYESGKSLLYRLQTECGIDQAVLRMVLQMTMYELCILNTFEVNGVYNCPEHFKPRTATQDVRCCTAATGHPQSFIVLVCSTWCLQS